LFYKTKAFCQTANPWNPRSRLASSLRNLTGVAHDGLDLETGQQLFAERRQPRAKDKPAIRW
jgi:hypothetical protein